MTDFLKKIVDKIINTELGRHALIALLLIPASFVISAIAFYHAVHLAEHWVRPLELRQVQAGFCKPPGQTAGPAQVRLEDDVKAIEGRVQHHLDLMIYFYANYYRAIIMSSILGAVSGICLFYIANKGWKEASNYVITTFVLSSVIGAFFFSLIAVFQQQNNIAANKTLYLKNVALRDQILSYCATGTTSSAAGKGDLSAFVHETDRDMADLNDIAVVLDSSHIVDYAALLKNEVNGKQPPDTETKPAAPVPPGQ